MCVCEIYDFLSVYLSACVSPHVSECVSKVPHGFIMSSKRDEQKSRGRKTGEVERKHKTRDVLVRMSCNCHSVLIVFISLAYCGGVLLLFVWPP